MSQYDVLCEHRATEEGCQLCLHETMTTASPDKGEVMASLDFLEEWWATLTLPGKMEDDPAFTEGDVYPKPDPQVMGI